MESAGVAVAEQGCRATREDGRHPMTALGRSRVPDRVDPTEPPVQQPARGQRPPALHGESEPTQLLGTEHPVLPEGEFPQTCAIWRLVSNIETAHVPKLAAIASHVGDGMRQTCNKGRPRHRVPEPPRSKPTAASELTAAASELTAAAASERAS